MCKTMKTERVRIVIHLLFVISVSSSSSSSPSSFCWDQGCDTGGIYKYKYIPCDHSSNHCEETIFKELRCVTGRSLVNGVDCSSCIGSPPSEFNFKCDYEDGWKARCVCLELSQSETSGRGFSVTVVCVIVGSALLVLSFCYVLALRVVRNFTDNGRYDEEIAIVIANDIVTAPAYHNTSPPAYDEAVTSPPAYDEAVIPPEEIAIVIANDIVTAPTTTTLLPLRTRSL